MVVHLQQVRQGLLLHAPAVPLDLSGSGGNGVDAGMEILLGGHALPLRQAGSSAQAGGPQAARMCYRSCAPLRTAWITVGAESLGPGLLNRQCPVQPSKRNQPQRSTAVSKTKLVDRALEWRLAGRRRSLAPSRAYQLRLKAPRAILRHAEAAYLPERQLFEARRQYLVCACAAFESYWRDMVREIVDSLGASEALLRSLQRHNFSFADLKYILGRRLQISELVACSYTFQHPDAVNRALSDCLSIDAFKEFSESRYRIIEVPRKNRRSLRPLAQTEVSGEEMALRRIPEIEQCFRIRHEAVHHTGHRHRLSVRDVYRLENALWIFNDLLGMFIDLKVRSQKRHSLKRQNDKDKHHIGAQKDVGAR